MTQRIAQLQAEINRLWREIAVLDLPVPMSASERAALERMKAKLDAAEDRLFELEYGDE